MNRAETEKIKAELRKLHAYYSGTFIPSTSSESKKNFVTIVYNDISQEHRQLQWLRGIGAGGQIMPIAEAMLALVLMDHALRDRGQNVAVER